MNRSLYGERDYAFGQRILTLRTQIGLTQTGLAKLLHVSRRAVTEWEAGSSYPTAEHLQQLIALGLQQHVFAAGREAEEIRALWRAAHQKVLLDEPWLQGLLSQQSSPLVKVAVEQTLVTDRVSAPPAGGEPRVDWGDALDVPTFYGREGELATLARWVVEEGCRMVSVLGMGGIGKSALAVTVMHRVAAHFDVVIWRSLRDAPGCAALLDECLQVLAPHLLRDRPDSLEGRLHLLMEQTVLCWLAIMREPVTLSELRTLLVASKPTEKLLEAVDGLLRRSLIESGQHPGGFTLQSVVLEYVTTQLVAEASHEVEQGQLVRLIQHGLVQAGAREYVRQAQERLLLAPLLAHLQSAALGHANVEVQVCALLDEMRALPENAQGYGPANLVTLLRRLRGDLRGLDLSRLALRAVSLQGVEMQDARLSGAALQDSVFTEPLDAITAVATSPDGEDWAAASWRGEVRVWREGGKILHLAGA
jgi:transcriptional regulator with XRE-family HTH domain